MVAQARQQIRAYAGAPVARSVRLADVYGSATAYSEAPLQQRRRGRYTGATKLDNATAFRYRSYERFLAPEELWQVYRVCSEVRSSIDGIVRKVSTWDWDVIPSIDPSDDRYELALDIAEEVRRFLAAPNTDGETWQDLISKTVRDLLVYDTLSIELCSNSDGTLKELVGWNGGYITPEVDGQGRVSAYIQQNPGEMEPVVFQPDELMYMNLFPNTTYPGGTPIIEAIINEVITCMTASKHLMLALDADEVPPGILLIAGVGGNAAKRMVENLKNMRGQDQKIRVLTTNNPRALSANWVELRHTPKDLELKDVVKEVKRTIWRAFGRKPASMGDTEATPRATAEVQMGAEESDLIVPILELLQAKINMRVMPRVVGDAEVSSLVAFAFDMEKELSEDDMAKRAERNAKAFDRGALTANEWRDDRGLPPVDGGDIPLVKSGGRYVPLVSLAGGDMVIDPDAEDVPEDEIDPEADGGDGDGGQDPEAAAPEEGEEGPGEVDAENTRPVYAHRGRRSRAKPRMARRVREALDRMKMRHHTPRSNRTRFRFHDHGHRHCCGHEPQYVRASSELLPSDWQPEGRFKNVRTINLGDLGESIIDYRRRVSPLYRQAREETLAAFRSYLGDDRIDNTEAAKLSTEINRILDKLHVNWSTTTEPMYRDAAAVGRDAASDFTGQQVVNDWRDRGDAYHDMAMGYLVGTRGLITDLREQLHTLVAASVRGSNLLAMHMRQGEADIDATTVLAAVAKTYNRNEHRIDNWSGRLVQLSNQLATLGMQEASSEAVDEDDPDATDGARAVEWWVEWVSVGDERECPTCEAQGSAGFRPLSALPTEPGGNTECRANCRCVLCFWTRDEVTSGKAVSLSGLG